MNQKARLRPLPWTLLLAAAAASPAQAQTSLLTLVSPEPQAGNRLCWAAVSVAAWRTVTKKDGQDPPSLTPTQQSLAVFNRADVDAGPLVPGLDLTRLTSTAANTIKGKSAAFKFRKKKCATDPLQCDELGQPILLDLDFTRTKKHTALSFCDLTRQIKDGRPVVFGWEHRAFFVDFDGRQKAPAGNHYAVVMGTRILQGKPQVKIYDPWPKQGSVIKYQHVQWIDYTVFVNPSPAHGADAIHDFDRYDIRRPGKAAVQNMGRSCAVPSPVIQPLVPVVQPIDLVGRQFAHENIAATLPAYDRPTLAAGEKLGLAFPMVALTLQQIAMAPGGTARLLDDDAHTVMIPIEDRAGRVVGVFSAVHEANGWRRAGYVNQGVAELMGDTRVAHFYKSSESKPEAITGYFMVSIPEWRMFFLAFVDPGTRTKMLVPIADDDLIEARHGHAEAAAGLLSRIAERLLAGRERG